MNKQNLFNSVQVEAPNYNMFDLSHTHKTTFNDGWLVPVMCEEAIPGDTWFIGTQALVRMAPMLAPVMHKFDVYIHYFYVPNRIIWAPFLEWVFGDDTVGPAPFLEYGDFLVADYQKLGNYLGLPLPSTVGTNYVDTEFVDAKPFSGYQCIYNEYYRDQNLIAEVPYQLTAGDNSGNSALYQLRRRAWEHDYFTSALPFAQRGNAVNLPLIQDFKDVPVLYNANLMSGFENLTGSPDNPVPVPSIVSPDSLTPNSLYAQTSGLQVTQTTINDLRRAYALQRWEEKNARGGVRPIESLKVHFDVVSDDARLQRPEYIVGVQQPLVISEVLNNTGETGGLPQGNMAGHGVMLMQGNFGKIFIKEHGYIHGILSVRPKSVYFQGVPRHFKKYQDRFNYFFRDFAHIGEQAVWNSEVFAYQAQSDQLDTFGYVPRYAEYKFANNRVSGEFTTNLLYWHAAREFSVPPALNQSFVECQTDNRIFAVTSPTADHYYADILHMVKVRRQMPVYGNPI